MADPKAPELSPAHAISHYSGDQWEEFVDELVEGIQSTRGYVLVKRMGGPGDLGIDVAGFKTAKGLEGPWDCYQCKQYAAPLQPSDAWPEILKIFRAAVAGECVMPDAYLFVAPKGAGLKLTKMLSQPTKSQRGVHQLVGDAHADPSDERRRAHEGRCARRSDGLRDVRRAPGTPCHLDARRHQVLRTSVQLAAPRAP